MSRTAEEFWEFEKVRELLRGRSTCAPGKRALYALQFRGTERTGKSIALIDEARDGCARGKELGLEALADPERWLAQSEDPAPFWKQGKFLEDSVAAGDGGRGYANNWRGEDKFPCWRARANR